MKPWLMKLHRWTALIFALPLLGVIGSGLVLSAEPALRHWTAPGSVSLERLEAILATAPEARGMFVQGYEGRVALAGRGGGSFSLLTGERVEAGPVASMFRTMRGLHEGLSLDLHWLVTASTIAMLVLLVLGLGLGWPRLRNSLGGWHKLTGWVLLPLLLASTVTGLLLAWRISLAPPAPQAEAPPASLTMAVRLVAERHDLARLEFIRTIGNQRLVRLRDASGTAITYRATTAGLQRMPTNWPRVLHEGAWLGLTGSIANLLVSLASLGLLGSGLWLYLRRWRQRRRVRALRAAAA